MVTNYDLTCKITHMNERENNLKANIVYSIDTTTGKLFMSPNTGEFGRLGKPSFREEGILNTYPSSCESFPGNPSTF